MSMKRQTIRQLLAAVALGLAAAAPSWATKISMETTAATGVVGLMPQAMASIWAKRGLDVELAMNQTLTKSLLKMAQGSLDASAVPPSSYADLKAGTGPYAQIGGKGAALSQNVRALWGFSSSNYHVIVWADGGITDWSKIKGKRVYVGPPAGAANAQVSALVKRASGYVDGKDYDAIKAPWGVAPQSFQDGQFDVLVMPTAVGSQAITEMALSRPIRMLALPADASPPPELGMVKALIPKGTYKGQVNNDEDIPVWQVVMMFMARKDLSEDAAYKLTKAYMENREELAKGNALLKELPVDDPFVGVIAPLHPGAVRYYQEAGIAIPAHLMPR